MIFMEVKLISIDKLKPFTKNPKIHPDHQLKKIEKSITEFGWTNPILATKDNMIVAGHARLEAAKRLNIAEVPVIFLDLPYEKAVAYVLADNRLAELAETDTEQLANLLNEIWEFPDFDFELTGYDESFLQTPKFDPVGEEEQGKLDELQLKTVTCPECGHEFET